MGITNKATAMNQNRPSYNIIIQANFGHHADGMLTPYMQWWSLEVRMIEY